ncbi:MAG: glycosyl transferase, partial [Tannerellaceae bacterium]|nr:glycosyl transferase [Tannerellaceae bacterium]
DKLPDKFVLKSTHASGHVIICRSKDKLNRRKACRTMSQWLTVDFFALGGEWVYKNIPRRIICEELIKGTGNQLPTDYKIFCFQGEPKLIFITSDRGEGNLKIDFYDCEWNWQPIRYHHYPNKGNVHTRPKELEKMLSLARALSSPFPHVRVDFYVEGERILVGELTFFTMCGLTPFETEEYDKIIGDWLSLPLRAGKAVIA